MDPDHIEVDGDQEKCYDADHLKRVLLATAGPSCMEEFKQFSLISNLIEFVEYLTKFNLGGGADASVVSAVSTRYLDIVIRLMMDMMVMMVFWHIPIMVGIRDARPAPRKESFAPPRGN